jgi:hypothetical protein
MSISLKYGDDTLPLDPDLYWADENQYSPVQQSVDEGLTGALIIQVDGDADRPGRPITLQPEGDDSAWMIRADLDQLNAWGAIAGAVMTLNLRGVDRSVMFRHQDKPAIDAKPVVHYSDVLDSDYYLVTLKFMTV